MESKEKDLELDQLVADFCSWQQVKNTEELLRANANLHKELKQSCKKSSLDQVAVLAREQEARHLRSTVEKLHKILGQKCDLQEENRQLKEEIERMREASLELENAHSRQMSEALDNLNTLTEAHKAEMASELHTMQLKLREQVASKEKELEEKVIEVKQLQREKAELERMRHTDTVKLRLEVVKPLTKEHSERGQPPNDKGQAKSAPVCVLCSKLTLKEDNLSTKDKLYDAKLLKLQKQQQARVQQTTQPSTTTNDIFRKKLQHMNREFEREVSLWKKKAEELGRQLQSVSHPSKKTRHL